MYNDNYNTKCPCCSWKFYVDSDYDGHAICVKCGSIFNHHNI